MWAPTPPPPSVCSIKKCLTSRWLAHSSPRLLLQPRAALVLPLQTERRERETQRETWRERGGGGGCTSQWGSVVVGAARSSTSDSFHPSVLEERGGPSPLVSPLCGLTDKRATAGKMVFLLQMLTLAALSVFGGASAATHREYGTLRSPVSCSPAAEAAVSGGARCCAAASSVSVSAAAAGAGGSSAVLLSPIWSYTCGRVFYYFMSTSFVSVQMNKFRLSVRWRSRKQVRTSVWRDRAASAAPRTKPACHVCFPETQCVGHVVLMCAGGHKLLTGHSCTAQTCCWTPAGIWSCAVLCLIAIRKEKDIKPVGWSLLFSLE